MVMYSGGAWRAGGGANSTSASSNPVYDRLASEIDALVEAATDAAKLVGLASIFFEDDLEFLCPILCELIGKLGEKMEKIHDLIVDVEAYEKRAADQSPAARALDLEADRITSIVAGIVGFPRSVVSRIPRIVSAELRGAALAGVQGSDAVALLKADRLYRLLRLLKETRDFAQNVRELANCKC